MTSVTQAVAHAAMEFGIEATCPTHPIGGFFDEPLKVFPTSGHKLGDKDIWSKAASMKAVLACGAAPPGLDPRPNPLSREENAMLRIQSEALQADPASASESWWPAAHEWEAEMQPGAVVWFHDLVAAQELNGECGVIDRWHTESSRWVVVTKTGEEKIARAENLQVVPPEAVYGSSGWDGASPWLWPGVGWSQWVGQDSYGAFGGTQGDACALGLGDEAAKAPRRRKRAGSGAVGGVEKIVGEPAAAGKARPHSVSTVSDVSTAAGGSLRSLSNFEGEAADNDASPTLEKDSETTVMMRNIPNNYTRDMLLELLDAQNFAGCYDLVYLPIDFQTQVDLGYAFIDLISHDEAERFRRHFHGFSGWRVVSEKVCEVSWSDALQGIQAHVDRYRNSPVLHDSVPDQFKPAIFNKEGERLPFPSPTKTIRPPRLRKFGPK